MKNENSKTQLPEATNQLLLLRNGTALLHFTTEYENIRYEKRTAHFWTLSDIDAGIRDVRKACNCEDWDLEGVVELGVDSLNTVPISNIAYDATVAIVLYMDDKGLFYILRDGNGLHISEIPIQKGMTTFVVLRKHGEVYRLNDENGYIYS